MAKNVGKASSAQTGDVDAYLATLPEEARPTVEKLRKTLRAAAPQATETISYGIAMLKLRGRPLVGFGATKNHCAFYVMNSVIC